MVGKNNSWEMRINRSHIFLIILIIVVASGGAFSLGNKMGQDLSHHIEPQTKTLTDKRNNIGKQLREKENAAAKKEEGNKIKENELTFYKTLTADKPTRAFKPKAVPTEEPKKLISTSPTPVMTPKKLNVQQTPQVKNVKRDGYVIQIGAFKNREEAGNLLRKMVGKGYQPYILSFEKDGSKWYRVRMGISKTVEEARNLASKVYREENIKALIIRLN